MLQRPAKMQLPYHLNLESSVGVVETSVVEPISNKTKQKQHRLIYAKQNQVKQKTQNSYRIKPV